MKTNPLPPREFLNEMFLYCPVSGILYWKIRPVHHFEDSIVAKRWNTRFSGKVAGNEKFSKKNGKSYVCVGFLGKLWFIHRVIFKIIYNFEPEQIDHINGNGLDNRMCNLRASDQNDNGKNKHRLSNNTSGICGVGFHRLSNRWRARITVDGKAIFIGAFKTFDEAVVARREAEIFYGFHEEHGSDRPL